MKVLKEQGERWAALIKAATHAHKVRISTYNLYTGISATGSVVRATSTWDARRFMDVLNQPNKDVQILVGIPPFIECNEGCEHCKERRESLIQRIDFHRKIYNNIDFRFVNKHHMKLYFFDLYDYDICFSGGVNLSNSSWSDILLEIPDPSASSELLEIFKASWKGQSQKLLTSRRIECSFKKQVISTVSGIETKV